MSKFNSTNYPLVIPVEDDTLLLRQDSTGRIKSVEVSALAEAISPLMSRSLVPSVVNGTLTLSTEQLVMASSAAPFDILLPAAAVNEGRPYYVFNSGAGAITLVADGTDTVGLDATLVLAQGESVILVSDGLGIWATFGAP